MPFASLVGNERIKRLLKRGVAEDRIRQGLIFAGPRGVGKHQFALALAQALNCRRPIAGDACGTCDQCIKIAAREHIDVETIVADGQFIKIAQMREMAEKANYRPYDGRRRVYILDDAERLNISAANSILKVLEEPPETTELVLVTAKPYALLQTIRSRCQMLSFAPLTAAELEAFLNENYKRPAGENRLLARLARGSIGRALEIDLGVYREQRTMMVELLEAAIIARDTMKLMQAAEYLAKKLERDEFERHLDALLVLLSDLFYLKLGNAADAVTNADIAPRLSHLAEAATLEQIIDWVERIEAIMQGLARNLNRQLAMEEMLLAV
ncbi:MAG TPA: DNA polymerase III subunit delta' [Blastocatellia bacterium]|nr:DNA polymerase III subunit delta' [Blastocatellia bacterium]